jgi:hypothetical protein
VRGFSFESEISGNSEELVQVEIEGEILIAAGARRNSRKGKESGISLRMTMSARR